MKRGSKSLPQSSAQRKRKREENREQFIGKLNRQRANFDKQAKLPFRLGDGEWLKLRYNGKTRCVIVYFDVELSYAEIHARMLKAFGNLNGEV